MDELRSRLPAASTASAGGPDSLDWFYVRASYLAARPIVVTIYDGQELSAILFLLERTIAGVPVGTYESPYQCGFCSYLGNERDKARNIADAMRFMLRRKSTIKVIISTEVEPAADAAWPLALPVIPGASVTIREKGSYLPIGPDLDSVLLRFGAKSRRNMRYFKRKAEELKCYRFLDALDDGQAADAVKVLNAGAARFMTHAKASYRRVATRDVPGGFSAGLVADDGTWLSYITGWRRGDVTYVDWQINREESNQLSFSTVMRVDFIEHEISRGATALYFLGGSNNTWENACEKHKVYYVTGEKNTIAIRSGRKLLLALAQVRPMYRLRKFSNTLHHRVAR